MRQVRSAHTAPHVFAFRAKHSSMTAMLPLVSLVTLMLIVPRAAIVWTSPMPGTGLTALLGLSTQRAFQGRTASAVNHYYPARPLTTALQASFVLNSQQLRQLGRSRQPGLALAADVSASPNPTSATNLAAMNTCSLRSVQCRPTVHRATSALIWRNLSLGKLELALPVLTAFVSSSLSQRRSCTGRCATRQQTVHRATSAWTLISQSLGEW